MSSEKEPWSVETMTVDETKKALKDIGDYLCRDCNSNYGQGVCERAIELLESEPVKELPQAILRKHEGIDVWVCQQCEHVHQIPKPPAGELKYKPFDAGLLNDYGGGKTDWWHDYIRSLLLESHEYYGEIISEACDRIDRLEKELKTKDGLLEAALPYIQDYNPKSGLLKEIEQALKGNPE